MQILYQLIPAAKKDRFGHNRYFLYYQYPCGLACHFAIFISMKRSKIIVYRYRKNRRLLIRIYKSRYLLKLLFRCTHAVRGIKLPKVYKIGIGRNPDFATKVQEGDERTPEGVYFICQKEILQPGKLGTRWMRLTYPNLEDIARGKKSGVIDAKTSLRLRRGYGRTFFKRIETPLGFGIGIHGTNQPSCIGTRCSDGCIRMRNAEVEELYDLVPLGTRVEIYP